MTQINLIALQFHANFYGHCFVCGELIPPDRLVRGGDTCSTDHQRQKRKSQRRFQKLLQQARLVASPATLKRLLGQGRSAPEASQPEVTQ